MSWMNMQVVTTQPNSPDRTFAYEYSETISQGNGSWILIPEGVSLVSVQLTVSDGATGKVQDTVSQLLVVKEGSPEIEDWPIGEMDEDASDVCCPVTAIRAVNTNDTGSIKILVRAQ